MVASPLHLVEPESPPLARELLGRELPSRDYTRIKIATRDLLDACGGARRAATHTRVGQPQLDRYADQNKPGEFMPADIVADLEAYCGVPLVSRELAELSGHELVALPAALGPKAPPLPRVTGQALKETADVFGRLGALMEDGVVTAVEDRGFARECREAIVMLLTLERQVHEQMEKSR